MTASPLSTMQGRVDRPLLNVVCSTTETTLLLLLQLFPPLSRAAGGGRRAAGGRFVGVRPAIDLNITVMPGWRSLHGDRVVRRQSAVQLPGRIVPAVFPSRFVAGAVRHQHYGAGHANPHRSLLAQRRRCLLATRDRHEEFAARRGETARQRAYDSSRTTPPSSVESPCSRERAACPATASASIG